MNIEDIIAEAMNYKRNGFSIAKIDKEVAKGDMNQLAHQWWAEEAFTFLAHRIATLVAQEALEAVPEQKCTLHLEHDNCCDECGMIYPHNTARNKLKEALKKYLKEEAKKCSG